MRFCERLDIYERLVTNKPKWEKPGLIVVDLEKFLIAAGDQRTKIMCKVSDDDAVVIARNVDDAVNRLFIRLEMYEKSAHKPEWERPGLMGDDLTKLLGALDDRRPTPEPEPMPELMPAPKVVTIFTKDRQIGTVMRSCDELLRQHVVIRDVSGNKDMKPRIDCVEESDLFLLGITSEGLMREEITLLRAAAAKKIRVYIIVHRHTMLDPQQVIEDVIQKVGITPGFINIDHPRRGLHPMFDILRTF